MPIYDEPLIVTDAHLALARLYPITVKLEDGVWVARTPDPSFPYVLGTGDRPEAAEVVLAQAIAGHLALAELQGRDVPAPRDDSEERS